jgi:cytochrome c oxidase subunit 2
LSPATSRRRRLRLLLAALGAAIAGLLALAAGAPADMLTPESGGSPNADEIDSLFKIVLYVAIVVFVGVEGALLYSVIRFRQRKGRVAAQIRGNTNLEIGWTVAAALVLVVLTAVTFLKLDDIKDPRRSGASGLYAQVDMPDPPGRSLNVDVNGQQYVWRYTYPNGAYAYDTMVVPVNTTVTLDIRSQDVVHSWWIPKLGGKFDATPGHTNKTWFKISKPGDYPGQCAELCGRNHANMLARVRAVPVAEYREWVARQKRDIQQAYREAAEQSRTQSPTR